MVLRKTLVVLFLGLSACTPLTEIKTVLLYHPIELSMFECTDVPEDCRRKLAGLYSYLRSWENDIDAMDPWTEEGVYPEGAE